MSASAPYQPEPARFHPAVVAAAIFMSGLFAIVLVLVLATRGSSEPAASATATPAAAAADGRRAEPDAGRHRRGAVASHTGHAGRRR